MSNTAKPADTTQAQAKADEPKFSWDSDDNASDDFLGDAQGQEVPKACSILEPSCEACQ